MSLIAGTLVFKQWLQGEFRLKDDCEMKCYCGASYDGPRGRVQRCCTSCCRRRGCDLIKICWDLMNSIAIAKEIASNGREGHLPATFLVATS